MSPATTALDRFLAALHRRHVLLRVLERTGLCVLVACAACAVLIPLLLWRGSSAVSPALWTLAMGVAAGLLWGGLRRPGALEAATEADRQLRLADLLGTALALRGQAASADPWAASVLATAEARCRGLSPSSVILHRLGARAWGGIGLATALVLAVALLASSPADTRAARADGAGAGAGAAPRDVPRDLDRPLVAAGGGSGQRPIPQGAGTDGETGRPGPGVTTKEQDASTQAARPGESPEARAGAGDTTGGNSGSSSTERRNPAGTPESTPPLPGTAATGAANPEAPSAGGAGRASLPRNDASATDSAAGTHAGAPAGSRPGTPGWAAPGFESGARRAREALDSGQVPAAYRDIVRKYFERP